MKRHINIIGHVKTKEQLSVAIQSADKRNMALPHMLFTGHPGCGKTTMAKYVANISKRDFLSVVPETLKDKKALTDLIEALNYTNYSESGDRIGPISPTIVFFDEIHRMPIYGQEKLGIIMEDFLMETGKPNKYFWVPYFTVIGATTLAGELSQPFLNRFKRTFFFEPYNVEESIKIVEVHAKLLGVIVTPKAVRAIAVRSRGIPRTIVKYLDACRDTALAKESEIITSALVDNTFQSLEIDNEGFTTIELKILKTLYNSEKPVGLDTLSVITGESPKTIKNELERYLLQEELVQRSGAGRFITNKGKLYLENAGYVGKKAGRIQISPEYKRS